jgi:signal transduction histidine kinase
VHKLLSRQLSKHFGAETPQDGRFLAFVGAVDAAYLDQDSDRALLERSIELASKELREKNLQLERDLESIKRLEIELRQADKLRAVGQLAAGIAHEINTPIQFASDSTYFLRNAASDLLSLTLQARKICEAFEAGVDTGAERAAFRRAADELDLENIGLELPQAFESLAEGLSRVSQIVLAMKDFGRQDQREKALVDLNRCLQSTLTIASNEVKYAAEVEVQLAEIPHVPGYQGELGQVFLNLFVNAAHAVTERFGENMLGRIRVSSALCDDKVEIRIADNGTGIRVEDQARIFEPFFTTKEIGRGTGQGLAISRSIIVDKHGGSLWFESERGVGTTFFIRLPSAT